MLANIRILMSIELAVYTGVNDQGEKCDNYKQNDPLLNSYDIFQS